MSIRNEEIGVLVLDAARRCLARSGGSRVTVSDVAREAGVSRPTIYRRWSDITEIVRALLTREVMETVEHALGPGVAAGTAEFRRGGELAAIIVDAVSALHANKLIESLWLEQRDFMAPYVFERLGTSQRGVLALLSDLIAIAQSRGQVRAGDTKQMAAMVLILAQSFLQSGALVSDILGEDWRAELRLVLDGYLRAPASPVGDGPPV